MKIDCSCIAETTRKAINELLDDAITHLESGMYQVEESLTPDQFKSDPMRIYRAYTEKKIAQANELKSYFQELPACEPITDDLID